MLKNILNLTGVQQLDKRTQLTINGGIDKCCIKIPGQPTSPCNTQDECKNSPCHCDNVKRE